jgi:SSS family solute:Na+ symporter
MVPYVGIQPLGVGLGFEALTGLSPVIGILYTVFILIIIILLGGMRITAWVNVFLGVVYTTSFLGSLIWVMKRLLPGGLSEAAQILSQKKPELLVAPGPEGFLTHLTIGGLLVAGMLSFSWPHVVIGTMTARDKVIFKWLPLLAIVVGGLGFYTVPFIWGSLVAPAISHLEGTLVPPLTGKEADNVVQIIITKYLPEWFSVFVLMGVMAAAISTAAVQLMASGILVSRDLIHGFLKPKATDEELIRWTKIAVITLLGLSLGIALWNPLALALYLTHIAVPGFAQWAPLLVGTVLWKRGTKEGAIAGLISGTLILILGFALGSKNVLIPALLVNILLYVVVSLFTKKPRLEVEHTFFDEVDDFLVRK